MMKKSRNFLCGKFISKLQNVYPSPGVDFYFVSNKEKSIFLHVVKIPSSLASFLTLSFKSPQYSPLKKLNGMPFCEKAQGYSPFVKKLKGIAQG